MATATRTTKRIVIDQDIPEPAIAGLPEFIDRYYVRPNAKFIEDSSYRKTESQGRVELAWTIKPVLRDERGTGLARPFAVNLKISQTGIELDLPDADLDDKTVEGMTLRITDEVEAVVLSYLANLKTTSLYFVIGATEKHAEAPNQRGAANNAMKRVFTGNTTSLFLSFTLLSFVLYFIIGVYTVFLLIGVQLVALIFSDRIVYRMGNVRPSAENPLVTIASVRSNPETVKSISQHGKKILTQIREEIVRTATVTDSPEKDDQLKSTIIGALLRHGIITSGKEIEVKTRNVYRIVQDVSRKFNRQPPKITIANTLISNASATGISSSRSTIMITAGSLEDLNDEELEAVIGHELGHVKGRDPIILFAATSFEFLGRFYLWFPLLLALGLLYFVIAFGGIFLVGKFLETRADTESAVVLGKPSALASALTKIGFRQLYREKYNPGTKLFDWFRFDPHPPIYFRIARLSEHPETQKIASHTLLVSIRDVITGFFSALFSV